jgi:hypothetical protein
MRTKLDIYNFLTPFICLLDNRIFGLINYTYVKLDTSYLAEDFVGVQ